MFLFGRSSRIAAPILLAALAGCGGSGSHSGPKASASVAPVVTLRWAERARVVLGPSSAQSVVIIVHPATGADFRYKVDRQTAPAAYTQTITLPQTFAPGRLDVTYEFHAGTGGAGDVVALAFASATLNSNGEGLDTVTTEGNLASVTVPSDQILTVGETDELGVEVRDIKGNLVAVSPGSIFWTSDTPSLVSFGPTGAHAIARGTAMVRATIDGKASAAASVRVTNQPLLEIIGGGALTTNCVLSGDGTTVFGQEATDTGTVGFVWHPGSALTPIAPNGGFNDFVPRGISRDGRVVVGYSTNGGGVRRATVWRAGAFTSLGVVDGDDTAQSEANGVSADGSVVVGRSDSSIGSQAFRWSAEGGLVGLGDFSTGDDGLSSSTATAVSPDGQTVVGQARLGDAAKRGFVWTVGGGLREIGAVVSPDSTTVEVNPTVFDPAGIRVYGYSDDVAWQWQVGGVTSPLETGRFMPMASGGGAVFGVSTEAPAAMWTQDGGLRNLADVIDDLALSNLLGDYRVSGVGGCSADGSRVLVLATKSDGSQATFLLTLP